MSNSHPSVVAVENTAASTERPAGYKVVRIAAKPRPSEKRRRPKVKEDPRLLFILAHQTILRWEFALRCMEPLKRSPTGRAAVQMEVELGLVQLRTVGERVRPFTRSRSLEVRFESEEVMVRLGDVEARLVGGQHELVNLDPSSPLRTARDIGERFLAKARGLVRD